MEKKPEIIEYPKCRVCGSEECYILSLATKEEKKGVNPDAIPHYLTTFQFAMRKANQLVIIGSKTVAGNVCLDVCKGCGTLRAVKIEIGEAIALDKPFRG